MKSRDLDFANKNKFPEKDNMTCIKKESRENEIYKGLNVKIIDEINDTLIFLINMKSPKLMYELYGLMKNQIQVYTDFNCFRVLELTSAQFKIFKSVKFEMDLFTQKPFNINSIVVQERTSLNYKYVDTKLELNRFLNECKEEHRNDRGLYFMSRYENGFLGNGVYVCDEDDDNSCYRLNGFINDRLNMLLSGDDEYLYYINGYYDGIVKKCVFGELDGIVVLVGPIEGKSFINKESLHLYGEISPVDEFRLSKDEMFEMSLQKNLPEYNIRLSSVNHEIIEGAQG